MPEGHTVARWANELRPMIGESIVDVRAPERWRERADALIGRHLVRVDTHGKNLLLRFDDGTTIRAHAMQYGSWQIGAPGMELRKESRYVRLMLRTAVHEAVFFHGPVMEILTAAEAERHDDLSALGPDVLAIDFDAEEAARRLRGNPLREIGDAILDQRNVAGIGNIYKSEGLYLAGIHPQRTTASITDDELARLWRSVIPLMRTGVAHAGATTTLPPELVGPGRWHWVYRRRGHPCFCCGTKILMVRQGELGRTTYFCPSCQPTGERSVQRARRAARISAMRR